MYKVEIDIGNWIENDEKLVIHTTDFDKAQIIQEFVAFQQEHGWAVDYEAVSHEDEDEDYVYDEDTDAWYWYDEDADTWYVYDEESDDWIEYVEDEDEDEDEDEEEEEEEEDEKSSTVTTYVITKVED